ncbi:MAG: hypothetical protein GXO73_09560 [Calditrichaeota bacterium]|nr:hypothetical protein [Calditrichota bacterium]
MNKASLGFGLLVFILAELHGVPLPSAAFRAAIGYVAFWSLLFVWKAVLWPLLKSAGSPSAGLEEVRQEAEVSAAEDVEQFAA